MGQKLTLAAKLKDQKYSLIISWFICKVMNLEIILLKSVDYGCMAEILIQREASSYDFTRGTAITWVKMPFMFLWIYLLTIFVKACLYESILVIRLKPKLVIDINLLHDLTYVIFFFTGSIYYGY